MHHEEENNTFLGLTEVQESTGIPKATLKRYMINHEEFIEVKKVGRQNKLNAADIEKLKRIRQLYNDGLKREDINARLRGPEVINHTSTEAQTNEVKEDIKEIKRLLILQLRENEQQKQFNEHLLYEIRQLKNELRRFDEERLTSFENEMNDTIQSLKEVSSSQDAPKGHWFSLSRMFDKQKKE
ncbi:MerR family transcriptional regulator [Pontibacillus yanchengensis]|uniref:MerR family transcriptional regulator n=2 Tax=Pontibacillus yanchengensis TaxID=462910 RepID=A0ACC7VFX2_9BACI|nr:MerR family transcriptional regulator [Pontibacillus yanchengensis]MYL33535.1 MerR family transcriptional regulator [Pontibacillus yanchengensis]MYL53585.1 MerR family transcriptional regulator [Pontibacillus yanchengensis]